MTQSDEAVRLEVRYTVQDHVAWLTIDREAKRNALSVDTLEQLPRLLWPGRPGPGRSRGDSHRSG